MKLPRTLLLLSLLATLVAAAPAAAQTYETSAMLGEVEAGRVTTISSGPERVTDRPIGPAGPRVERQAAVAPEGPGRGGVRRGPARGLRAAAGA
jgi:hypothetical protein